MLAVFRDQQGIPGLQGNVILGFELESRSAGDEDDPFVVGLVIPEVLVAGLAVGSDVLQRKGLILYERVDFFVVAGACIKEIMNFEGHGRNNMQ